MPWVMNQRPSLVWQMLGEWFGNSAACRLVRRHSGTRRITQYMMSCSGFFDTASWIAHRDVLALAAAFAVDQRGDDAGRQLLAGDVIGVPDLRRDRRRVVFEVGVGVVAAIHHDAAEREMDEVGALEVRPRPVIAERRHPRRHQLPETAR